MTFGLEVNILFAILYSIKNLLVKHDLLVLEIPIQFQILFICALVLMLDPPWSAEKPLGMRCLEVFTLCICLLVILYSYSGSIPRGTLAFILIGPVLSVFLTRLTVD